MASAMVSGLAPRGAVGGSVRPFATAASPSPSTPATLETPALTAAAGAIRVITSSGARPVIARRPACSA